MMIISNNNNYYYDYYYGVHSFIHSATSIGTNWFACDVSSSTMIEGIAVLLSCR